jgi:hypothetical protein
MSPSEKTAKALSAWTPDKQQTYRQRHPEQAVMLTILLDASPSMAGAPATALRSSFNMYLAWLQAYADPMSLVDVRTFSTALSRPSPQPLGLVQPLTAVTYDPLAGDGTALYRAVGVTCTQAEVAGQHLLIVFTDGRDNRSAELGWHVGQVLTLFTTLQQEQDWCGVFLGAFPEALEVGTAMGFAPTNCLTFASDRIPEAFRRLRQATRRYLTAGAQERKLLTQGGLF